MEEWGRMDFPERVYTKEEVKKARTLIEKGYKHDLKTKGSPEFVAKVEEALKLIKLRDTTSFCEHTSGLFAKSRD